MAVLDDPARTVVGGVRVWGPASERSGHQYTPMCMGMGAVRCDTKPSPPAIVS